MLSNIRESSSEEPIKNIGIKTTKLVCLTDSKRVAVRNADFVANARYADMYFYVERDDVDVPAHRVVVCSASQVLDKCLTGSGALTSSNRITISDISLPAFHEVLRFIYTDTLIIDANDAIDILVVAHYLDLTDLVALAVQEIMKTVNIYNVCSVFASTHNLGTELNVKCLEQIQSQTDWLILNGDLMNMDEASFVEVFKLDRLNIMDEVDLFIALLKWASNQCLLQGLSLTSKMRRCLMGKRLDCVRFAAMEMSDFMRCIKIEPAFFSSDEVSEITTAIQSGQPTTTLSFISNQKRISVQPKIQTTQLFHWKSNGIRYRNFPPEDFVVKALAPILIYGFGMYGRNGLAMHNAKHELLDLKSIEYDEPSGMSKLMLAKPVLVLPGEAPHFIAHHDAEYDHFFYFVQMEYTTKKNAIFGYTIGVPNTNKFVRVVEIYYEDLG